jgi:hypothetical protein
MIQDFKKHTVINGIAGYEVLGIKTITNFNDMHLDSERLKKPESFVAKYNYPELFEVIDLGLIQFIGDRCISPLKFWQKEDFEAKLPKDRYVVSREKQNGRFTGWLKLKVKNA